MRKVLLVIGVALVALVAAAALSISALSAGIGESGERLLADLQDDSGLELTAGAFGLSILPRPALEIRDFTVTREGAKRIALEADVVRVYAGLSGLLAGSFEGGEVEVISATVRINPNRRDELLPLLRGSDGGRSRPGAIERWVLRRSRLVYEATGDHILNDVELELTPSPSGAELAFRGSGRPLDQRSSAALSGRVSWQSGPQGSHDLEFEFSLGALDVEALREIFAVYLDDSFGGDLDVRGTGKGFLGTRTTEDAPAEPLKIEVEGGFDWTVVGRTEPLTFTVDLALDDRRLIARDGSIRWGGQELGIMGWMQPWWDAKFRLRFPFEGVDVAAVAEEFGVPEQWRPDAVVDGEVEITGRPSKYQMRYEGSAEVLTLRGARGYDLEMPKPRFQGSLLASNAVASVSVTGPSLRIGYINLPAVLFGARYFREKVTGGTYNAKLLDGEVTVSVSYEPQDGDRFRVGGKFSKVDAAGLASTLIDDYELSLDGTAHANFLFSEEGGAREFYGRVGLTDTIFEGVSLGRQLFTALGNEADLAEVFTEDLIDEYPRTFGENSTELLSFALEFERDDEEGLRIANLRAMLSRELALTGSGRVGATGGQRLRIEGAVEISPEVTAKLVAAAPWLEALVGTDEILDVPVTIGGEAAAPDLVVPDSFVSDLERASAGAAVEPFEARVEQTLEIDLPPLPGGVLF